jgi:hypothetical protein
MSENTRLRPLIVQLVDKDSTQRRMERQTAFLIDMALFTLLVAQSPSSPLILWSVGIAVHLFAAFPPIFKRPPQSVLARQHAEMIKARRALERLGVGASSSEEKAKNDEENYVLDDGELAIPWLPDAQELRWNVRRLIRLDHPAQRERLKRARLIHVVLFFVHIVLFGGANMLLTPRLDLLSLLGWTGGLLLHAFTVFAVEPTAEDDEKRVQLILDNLHSFDLLDKRKKSESVQLSSDGELVWTRKHGEK